MHIYEVWVKGLMIRAAVRAQIVDKPSRVDIVDFQAIWLRGQDVAPGMAICSSMSGHSRR